MVFLKEIFFLTFFCFTAAQWRLSELQTSCSSDNGTVGIYQLKGNCNTTNKIVGHIALLEDSGFVVCCTEEVYKIDVRFAKVGEKSKEYCKKHGVKISNLGFNIVGGTDSAVGEFPHAVVLGYNTTEPGKYVFHCGGSLISEKFVITAAHCLTLKGNQPEIVRIGRVSTPC